MGFGRSFRAQSACVAGAVALAALGCGHAQIPYDLSLVMPRGGSGSAPVHAKRIALLPFKDARAAEEGPDSTERYVYHGIEFVHTDLEDLRGSPWARITELVARHIAATRLFSQVILVLSPDQAPEADLVMSGAVERMRGYVEAGPPDSRSGRPEGERMVLAEVVLADIEVRDAHAPAKLLFDADVGWSVYEKRFLQGDRSPDPWEVLSEALFKALSDLSSEIERADLSGALLVSERVSLGLSPTPEGGLFGELERSPPAGWRFAVTSTLSRPVGWRTIEARCREATLEQLQTLRFHRVLGPYRPSIVLWVCPEDLGLSYDALEEFPARYLGQRANGSRYFARALGESNWPEAVEDIRVHLGVHSPVNRYIFEIDGR